MQHSVSLTAVSSPKTCFQTTHVCYIHTVFVLYEKNKNIYLLKILNMLVRLRAQMHLISS